MTAGTRWHERQVRERRGSCRGAAPGGANDVGILASSWVGTREVARRRSSSARLPERRALLPELLHVPREGPAREQGARDVVEPQALAGLVQLLGRLHASS